LPAPKLRGEAGRERRENPLSVWGRRRRRALRRGGGGGAVV